MNAQFHLLSKYAEFLLQNHLDRLVLDSIRRAKEYKLPILKQLENLSDDQLFDISKKGFAEDILIPLSTGIPFEKVKENIENWKSNNLILAREQISNLDITSIYHIRKLSMLEMMEYYDYSKMEGIKLHQEIESYFNHCINLAYQAYEEIQRGALQESQAILNGILCNIPVIVTRLDKEGNMLKSIGCGLSNLGVKDGDFVGSNVFTNYPDAENIRRALKGEKVSFLGTANSKTGDKRYYQSYFFPEGEGAIGFSMDITDQKNAEEKFRESEYFIKKITDSAPIIINVYDRINNVIVYANKHLPELLGYTTEQIDKMGSSVASIVHPDDLPKLMERNQHLEEAEDGQVIESEMRVKDAHGEYKWIFTRTTVFKRTTEGKVSQSLSISIETTEKKKAEEKVEQQLRIFDTALSNTLDFNYVFDLDKRFIYLNKPLLKVYGKTQQEAFGKNFREIGFPDHIVDLHNSQLQQVIDTKQPVYGENEFTNNKGETGYYKYAFVPVLGDDGNVEAIVGSGHDISEIREDAEQQYKSIFESSNDAISIYDENGILVEINPAGYKLHGYTYEEMIGKNGKNIIVSEDHPTFDEFIKVVKQGKNYFANCRHKRKDGSIIFVEKTGSLFNFRGKPHMLAVVHDITERKKAEEARKESEERFRTMAENIPNLAWIANDSGFIIWYNKRWYEYSGTTPEQMEGWGWQSIHHPEELPKVMAEWKKSILTGEKFEMTFPLKGADGVFRPFLTRVNPVRNNEGKIVRWFGTNTDVSEVENKNKELLKINADLDNFIYTASHDLKAPVANIEGLLSSLVDVLTDDNKNKQEFKQILEMIERSIRKFKNTILDLTEISKVQKLEQEDISQIDCLELIEDVKFTILDQIKESGAAINLNIEDCNFIQFSRKHFQSIVYNLLSNAIKYRSPERPLRVDIGLKKENDFVILSVRDNGLGISSSNQTKVFSMFKRFHDHVEGTGIGLYIVKRIVDNAGGKVEVDSEENTGTTFRIYFPVDKSVPRPVP